MTRAAALTYRLADDPASVHTVDAHVQSRADGGYTVVPETGAAVSVVTPDGYVLGPDGVLIGLDARLTDRERGGAGA